MAKVAIITSHFPYGVPEQFFEAELPLWAESGHEVTLLPMRCGGKARTVPAGVTLDHSLAVLDTFKRKGSPLSIVRALVDVPTLQEVSRTLWDRKFSFRGAAEIISTEAQVRHLRTLIRKAYYAHDGFDVVYAYWHGPAAYAAAAESTAGTPIGWTAARAHRVDLLEESRPSGHHPRKRQYQRMIDRHVPISDMAAEYLVNRYGVDPDRILISRLGVAIPEERSRPSPRETLRILSISYVTPIKRVPSILRAVESAAAARPQTKVEWTHLGSGPGFAALKEAADEISSPNLSVTLAGQVAHDDVLEYLASQAADIFVNFSSSEGVPVSIMEAMAHGIPAIAPSLGGIPELVDSDCGTLLPHDASEGDLANAIVDIIPKCKDELIRDAAAQKVANLYDARANFRKFIAEVTSK